MLTYCLVSDLIFVCFSVKEKEEKTSINPILLHKNGRIRSQRRTIQ